MWLCRCNDWVCLRSSAVTWSEPWPVEWTLCLLDCSREYPGTTWRPTGSELRQYYKTSCMAIFDPVPKLVNQIFVAVKFCTVKNYYVFWKEMLLYFNIYLNFITLSKKWEIHTPIIEKIGWSKLLHSQNYHVLKYYWLLASFPVSHPPR